jgi:hypothetical protein
MVLSTGIEFPAANVTKVWIGDRTILFSYAQPVAVWHRGGTEPYIRRYALKKCETPTSAKHLNQHGPKRFLAEGDHYQEVTLEELDGIISRDEFPAE